MDLDQLNMTAVHEEGLSVEFTKRVENDLCYVDVKITSEQPRPLPPVTLVWHYPMVDIQSYWHPGINRSKSFGSDWDPGFSAKATVHAPVGCFYNQAGRNRLAVAFSDALETVDFNLGVNEETARIKAQITLFTEPSKIRSVYEATLRLDTRDLPYYEAIADLSMWYEGMEGYTPALVPPEAKLPMYSTWYSFHQELSDLEIEKQCEIAKQLGCEAVIVDDGWQTEDNQRGYAFCGDWEPAPGRIPNMKAHVRRVHELGMKYLLWYSVPFVGAASRAWERFKDKTLYFHDRLGAGVLDPRYPEVREYLISIYKDALLAWDLDGFKLDFIDEFDLSRAEGRALLEDPDRDFESVQEAVDVLFSDIMETLRSLKPNVMIEFRQRYIGPYMRKYGNIFRVGDCPNNAVINRVGVLDLRLLSGNTAVHSDMIMWNGNDTTENAALQLINVLFGVPQFSMRFEKLKPEHFKMAKFWLHFSRTYQDVLLHGSLHPVAPELLYPLIESTTNRTKLMAMYANMVVKTGIHLPEELVIVNGTLQEEVVLDVEEALRDVTFRKFNCMGDLVEERKTDLPIGLHKIKVEKAGVVVIKK